MTNSFCDSDSLNRSSRDGGVGGDNWWTIGRWTDTSLTNP